MSANIDPLRPSKQDGSTRVLCATCGHSEFVHADDGDQRCRYSVCNCDRFVVDAELDSRHRSFLPWLPRMARAARRAGVEARIL
jgi:hypothetical protein